MVDNDLGTPSYSISKGVHGWIQEFLKNKGLQRPDRRALYAYRCTEEEFNLLAVVLRQKKPHSEPTVTEMRGFRPLCVRMVAKEIRRAPLVMGTPAGFYRLERCTLYRPV